MTRAVRMHAAKSELLEALAAGERDLRLLGGINRQRRRCDLIAMALSAGCTVQAIADVLGATLNDVRAWGPAVTGGSAGRRRPGPPDATT